MCFALSELAVTSSDFIHGGMIPEKHTGEGDDISPALSWRHVPRAAQSLAIFCHDPDAPLVHRRGAHGFVHWILYNIPPTVGTLEQGVNDFAHGKNDFERTTYNGPMPPAGHGPHQYYFWLLAIDLAPQLIAGMKLPALLERIEPHIVGMNRLVGTYER
jgi:Raf kinase inhibitor-like YbhB/YbcL family protein